MSDSPECLNTHQAKKADINVTPYWPLPILESVCISSVFTLKVSWIVRAILRYWPAKIQCCARKMTSPVEKKSKLHMGISFSSRQV